MRKLTGVAAKVAMVVLVLAMTPAVVVAAAMAAEPAAAAPEPVSAEPAVAQTIADTFPNLKVGRFTGELHLVLEQKHEGLPEETVDGRSLWAVAKPLTYRSHAGDIITLPPGMTTDLASIPRLLWSFLPPDGPWVQIAVFHDLLYKTHGTGVYLFKRPDGTVGRSQASRSRATPYTRQEADELLRDGMNDLGVSGWRRWAIYNGVRVGGGAGWSR